MRRPDEKLELRRALITDLPFVYRGEEAYIRRWEPAHEVQWREQLERHLSRWVENVERLFIAILDAQAVGYCLWMPEGDAAELCTLHVSESQRNNGISQALLDAYLSDATRHGFTRLTLSVRGDNPAKRLYERAGFAQVGTNARGYLLYRRDT